MSNSSLSPASEKATRTTGSQAKSESRAQNAEVHGTASSLVRSTVGTHDNQSASLVVAARPSAGSSPARARRGICRSSSRCRIGLCSGTLPFVKHGATLLTRLEPGAGFVFAAVRSPGSKNRQSSAKVSRLFYVGAWLGLGRKGGSSKAAPNPFIEGTAKGLRPSSAPHVER